MLDADSCLALDLADALLTKEWAAEVNPQAESARTSYEVYRKEFIGKGRGGTGIGYTEWKRMCDQVSIPLPSLDEVAKAIHRFIDDDQLGLDSLAFPYESIWTSAAFTGDQKMSEKGGILHPSALMGGRIDRICVYFYYLILLSARLAENKEEASIYESAHALTCVSDPLPVRQRLKLLEEYIDRPKVERSWLAWLRSLVGWGSKEMYTKEGFAFPLWVRGLFLIGGLASVVSSGVEGSNGVPPSSDVTAQGTPFSDVSVWSSPWATSAVKSAQKNVGYQGTDRMTPLESFLDLLGINNDAARLAKRKSVKPYIDKMKDEISILTDVLPVHVDLILDHVVSTGHWVPPTLGFEVKASELLRGHLRRCLRTKGLVMALETLASLTRGGMNAASSKDVDAIAGPIAISINAETMSHMETGIIDVNFCMKEAKDVRARYRPSKSSDGPVDTSSARMSVSGILSSAGNILGQLLMKSKDISWVEKAKILAPFLILSESVHIPKPEEAGKPTSVHDIVVDLSLGIGCYRPTSLSEGAEFSSIRNYLIDHLKHALGNALDGALLTENELIDIASNAIHSHDQRIVANTASHLTKQVHYETTWQHSIGDAFNNVKFILEKTENLFEEYRYTLLPMLVIFLVAFVSLLYMGCRWAGGTKGIDRGHQSNSGARQNGGSLDPPRGGAENSVTKRVSAPKAQTGRRTVGEYYRVHTEPIGLRRERYFKIPDNYDVDQLQYPSVYNGDKGSIFYISSDKIYLPCIARAMNKWLATRHPPNVLRSDDLDEVPHTM